MRRGGRRGRRSVRIDHAVIAKGAIHFPGAGAQVALAGACAGGTELASNVEAGAGAGRAFAVIMVTQEARHFAEAVADGAGGGMTPIKRGLLEARLVAPTVGGD